ncbi:MAG: endo-1,4-beta-xylanase [Clostridia bacterium]|nr:endo-1,4-beta-xylanase [Clostridia bacterium]
MKKWLCFILVMAMLLPLIGASAQSVSLNQLTIPHGFTMGAALSYGQMRDTKYLELLKQHFGSVTATNEMKAYSLLDQRASKKSEDGMPVMNYAQADAMVGWAQANGIKVRGHVLVWDAYMCDWFFREEYNSSKPYADPETIKLRTESYITQVVTHFEEKFPGVVYCWDVVNEAVGDSITDYNPSDPRHLRTMRSGSDNLFQKYMGDDYVELSFLYARNAVESLGADIKLYYNDYNAYFPDKASAIIELAKSINSYATDENGNPRKLIDGIGMQGYIGGYGSQSGCLEDSHPTMIKNAIEGYAAIGLDVQITEMAVRNYELEQVDKHAQFYAKLFENFMSLHTEDGNPLNNVTIWGLLDNPNERKGTYTYNLNSPYCGLFDEKLAEKNAFHAVVEQLKK